MTFTLIHADAVATLASDDPVIPAGAVAALRSTVETLAEAGRLHATIEARCQTATAAAHAQGLTAGHAAGTAAAAAVGREQLLALTRRAGDERQRLRGEVSGLAIEVVRRIAAGIGEADVVAALAEGAAAELLPDAIATVRVPPPALDATRHRLARWPGLTVVADATLAASDCIVETPLGASHAGLDVQLAAVERAWDTAADGIPHAG